MNISKGAVAILAAVCLTIGAAGAYLTSRSAQPASETTFSESVSPDPATEAAVEQSEGLISDASAPALDQHPAAPAVAPATPSRRVAAPAPARPSAPTALRPRTAPAADPASQQPTYSPREDARVATPPAIEMARPSDRVAERAPDPEPVRAPEPPAPQFEELIVSADSVIGLEVETSISSERARVEDAVVARVTRDVRVGDRVAIPAGSKAQGEVTTVERGGRLKDRARLGIRFTSVVLADGTRVPLETETIYREGSGPANESAAKIGGGAIGGAIIGGILGGAKGAIIGGSAGAGAGTAAVMAGGRNPATLPSGTPVTVRVAKPATVTVDK
jgi:type IV secretory pathway VirB10-like protein